MPELVTSAPGVEARRVAPDRQLLLHCDPEDARQIAQLTGLELPEVMLTSGHHGGWDALHLSPDEWLLIGEIGTPEVQPRLEAVMDRFALSLVDVSERSRSIDISGVSAARLLNGGCPLDFEAFGEGACTRTLFGKVTVMLWWRVQGVRMSYSRSFDDYVCALLTAIAADLADEAG